MFEDISKVFVYNKIIVYEKVIIENNIIKASSKTIISNGYIKEYIGSTLLLTKKIIDTEKNINNIKDSKGIMVEYKRVISKLCNFNFKK